MDEMPLGFLIASVGQQTMAAFGRLLADSGVSPRAYGVLRVVRTRPPMTQTELSRAVGLPTSRMVALVDDLAERRLLERVVDPHDRRAYRIRLTRRGESLLRSLQAGADGLDESLRQGLSDPDVRRLRRLLTTVSTQLESEGTPRSNVW